MVKVQLLTSIGCSHCAHAKEVLKEVSEQYPDLEVEEIDITTDKGQEMVSKYMVMSSPGVIIDGELFSQGGLEKDKLISKLEELKSQN